MVDLSGFGRAVAAHREAAARAWQLTVNEVTFRGVEAAVNAAANKGHDVSAARALLPEGETLYQAGQLDDLAGLISHINSLLFEAPLVGQPAFEAPDSLEGIRAACPSVLQGSAGPFDSARYQDRVLGGWLGKIIGGALGAPIEGWPHDMIAGRHSILSDYIINPPNTANDDPAYQVLLLHAVETYGPDFTSDQLAREWVAHVPAEYAYTAERIALDNLRRGLRPPQSGSFNNPFSEWVGAQMKGEICGWLAPTRPGIALELAYRDAIIAHAGEGIYGEIFSAVMVSAAFVERATVGSVIKIAEGHIPTRSKYASVVRQMREWCTHHDSWQDAWAEVSATYAATYHWVHSFPNIAAVLVGLHYGEGDFERTLLITARCGLDADTNAAQAGAVIGTLVGNRGIPSKWRDPVGNALPLPLIGFEQVGIDDLARRTCEAGRHFTVDDQ